MVSTEQHRSAPSGVGMDVVLSSGFLAFAAQAGFLSAVESLALPVDGICGTSSGALAGALWAAGMPAEDILTRLTSRIPLFQVRPSRRPWRGVLSLNRVIQELRADLPPCFEDLTCAFGVGVMDRHGRAVLRTSGRLPEAVAASCAIPRLFCPVRIDGEVWADGGMVDRTALSAWRAHRPARPIAMHLVARSSGAPLTEDLSGIAVVRTPRSGAHLWNLGDVQGRFARARRLALHTLSSVSEAS